MIALYKVTREYIEKRERISGERNGDGGCVSASLLMLLPMDDFSLLSIMLIVIIIGSQQQRVIPAPVAQYTVL